MINFLEINISEIIVINLFENSPNKSRVNKGAKLKTKMAKGNEDQLKDVDFDVKTSDGYSRDLERQARILQKAQEKVNSSLKKNIDILNSSKRHAGFIIQF